MQKLWYLIAIGVVGCASFDIAAAQTTDLAPANIDPAARLSVTAAKPSAEADIAARVSALPTDRAVGVDPALLASVWPTDLAVRVDPAARAAVRSADLAAAQYVSGGATADAVPVAPRGVLPAETAGQRWVDVSALQTPAAAAAASAPAAVQMASAPSKQAELQMLSAAPAGGAQPAAKAMASMSAKKAHIVRSR
jgi:hypothetical protein